MCIMILKIVLAWHVTTIPKSPPKLWNTYTGSSSQFFLCKIAVIVKICPVSFFYNKIEE